MNKLLVKRKDDWHGDKGDHNLVQIPVVSHKPMCVWCGLLFA